MDLLFYTILLIICPSIWGNVDAAEYKHVVLGLIFLKYISDKFDQRFRELEADDDDVEDKDAYAEVGVLPSLRHI